MKHTLGRIVKHFLRLPPKRLLEKSSRHAVLLKQRRSSSTKKDYQLGLVRRELHCGKETREEIVEEFNVQGLGPKRTLQQLKSAWERIKMRAKKVKADNRRESMKTGGGPAPKDLPEDDNKVLDILSEEIDDIGCDFDCDEPSSSAAVVWYQYQYPVLDMVSFKPTIKYSDCGLDNTSVSIRRNKSLSAVAYRFSAIPRLFTVEAVRAPPTSVPAIAIEVEEGVPFSLPELEEHDYCDIDDPPPTNSSIKDLVPRTAPRDGGALGQEQSSSKRAFSSSRKRKTVRRSLLFQENARVAGEEHQWQEHWQKRTKLIDLAARRDELEIKLIEKRIANEDREAEIKSAKLKTLEMEKEKLRLEVEILKRRLAREHAFYE
ncbi:hypothetical protein Pcinc_004274 [Petrolisthes cinctipes]|uniref:Regulatory protein zeste n=1 Tax=Petrolisthes cinctipes TaxID=88211 RepID=A0AAE1L0E3_PETCI|nr:hypothetical protein Pcinc_004274 [Petrolisthes cinctipes]